MTIHLSGNREQIVRSFIEDGRFTSEDEVIDEALRLLQERDEQARAETGTQLESITSCVPFSSPGCRTGTGGEVTEDERMSIF
jgi:putative addiction module CopG family antidote